MAQHRGVDLFCEAYSARRAAVLPAACRSRQSRVEAARNLRSPWLSAAGPNGIRTRVLVTVTFSPAVSYRSRRQAIFNLRIPVNVTARFTGVQASIRPRSGLGQTPSGW